MVYLNANVVPELDRMFIYRCEEGVLRRQPPDPEGGPPQISVFSRDIKAYLGRRFGSQPPVKVYALVRFHVYGAYDPTFWCWQILCGLRLEACAVQTPRQWAGFHFYRAADLTWIEPDEQPLTGEERAAITWSAIPEED